jgi:beta-glucosidase
VQPILSVAYCDTDWEGFGSDPILQAFGGALSVEGIQSVGVVATIKHLIANEQEQYRMYSLVKPGISSNLDDRTMHELYLWPFAEGVRSGVGSVMIAYNAVSYFGLAYDPPNIARSTVPHAPRTQS